MVWCECRSSVFLQLKYYFGAAKWNATRFCTVAVQEMAETTKKEKAVHVTEKHPVVESRDTIIPSNYRYVYPEFLPDPNLDWRNAVREKLERMDMLYRRQHIDIPEFYVGSILAVTISDRHSSGKPNRFVGICIQRTGCGLRACFVLRNVVDNQGVELKYELYSPIIRKIEVLRLEKRLDNELLYLRDAPHKYSTFPFDMEPEFHPEGAPVPINTIKVVMNPKPWIWKYERKDFEGMEIPRHYLHESHWIKAEKLAKTREWEKYDIMNKYRATIPDEEQWEIFSEIYSELRELEQTRRKVKRKKAFVKPERPLAH